MNKLRIMSDIHLEFSNGKFELPVMSDEKEQICVIAGDLAPITKGYGKAFVYEMCSRFKSVVMVAGNHEYYNHGSIIRDIGYFNEIDVDYENFHFLNNDMVIIDDTIFLGCTLWTNLLDHDPQVMQNAKYGMNDFNHILYNDKTFSIANWLAENEKSREFLWDMLEEYKDDGREIVVITHHLPSETSITDQFYYTRGENHKYAYCSNDMDEWLKRTNLWIHGHVHNSVDYVIHGCRVVSNPRGYQNYEDNINFDKELIIEV